MPDKLYNYFAYVRFTVDVVKEGVIQRGYVTDIADDGLIIDFHHNGPLSTEVVKFSCIRILPSKTFAADRYLEPVRMGSEVEVLLRDTVAQPLTWRKATFVGLVPDYGNKMVPDEEGAQFSLVRLQSRNPFSLAVVTNLWPPFVASDIRIRQKRLWRTISSKSFSKVTVPYTSYSCTKADCPFPKSPLFFYMKHIDVITKLVWLEGTGTLLLSADDVSVTVLSSHKTKRLPKIFHRLVFHLCDQFMERYITKGGTTRKEIWRTNAIQKLLFFPKWLASKSSVAGALIFKGLTQDLEVFPTLHALPDVLLRETLQSIDRISQDRWALKCVCRRWYRLQSSPLAKKCVILEAPDRIRNHPVQLANAMLKHTTPSTRSLLLMQFSPNHSYTAIRLIKEMQLHLEFYVSYRSTDRVHWRSQIHDLEDELAFYPSVSNLQISCSMKSKSGERLTLEIIVAASDGINCLLNRLGGGWVYCCTTKIMVDTVKGISRVLDALNLRCFTHGKLSEAVDCQQYWQWEEGERLKNDMQRWPICSAAFEALTRGFENYCPPSESYSYCQETGFHPDILKVLIRKPRLVGEEHFSSCGVQSWLRFT
ncbi:uncharacterized protein LOC129592494 [Paramacrobiotus metropolitanus]|uniref:uncharacterized protein LOC129592494 n=1 Tax=Paramacrobiotus metropolitanus TaxID=2943436 RepID=UPI002445D29D|nr:uncharacterized protein LOC129592494 [Paramacrobiotus metropolitanus]